MIPPKMTSRKKGSYNLMLVILTILACVQSTLGTTEGTTTKIEQTTETDGVTEGTATTVEETTIIVGGTEATTTKIEQTTETDGATEGTAATVEQSTITVGATEGTTIKIEQTTEAEGTATTVEQSTVIAGATEATTNKNEQSTETDGATEGTVTTVEQTTVIVGATEATTTKIEQTTETDGATEGTATTVEETTVIVGATEATTTKIERTTETDGATEGTATIIEQTTENNVGGTDYSSRMTPDIGGTQEASTPEKLDSTPSESETTPLPPATTETESPSPTPARPQPTTPTPHPTTTGPPTFPSTPGPPTVDGATEGVNLTLKLTNNYTTPEDMDPSQRGSTGRHYALQLTPQLTETFINTPGFDEVVINGFSKDPSAGGRSKRTVLLTDTRAITNYTIKYKLADVMKNGEAIIQSIKASRENLKDIAVDNETVDDKYIDDVVRDEIADNSGRFNNVSGDVCSFRGSEICPKPTDRCQKNDSVELKAQCEHKCIQQYASCEENVKGEHANAWCTLDARLEPTCGFTCHHDAVRDGNRCIHKGWIIGLASGGGAILLIALISVTVALVKSRKSAPAKSAKKDSEKAITAFDNDAYDAPLDDTPMQLSTFKADTDQGTGQQDHDARQHDRRKGGGDDQGVRKRDHQANGHIPPQANGHIPHQGDRDGRDREQVVEYAHVNKPGRPQSHMDRYHDEGYYDNRKSYYQERQDHYEDRGQIDGRDYPKVDQVADEYRDLLESEKYRDFVPQLSHIDTSTKFEIKRPVFNMKATSSYDNQTPKYPQQRDYRY